MPTTSRPPRRKGKAGIPPRPLKGIRLTVTLIGSGHQGLEAIAAANGLTMQKRAGGISLTIAASSAEDALQRLRLLSELLTSKG